MPLLIRFGLDNYAHAQTVDTRPFFVGRVGPGNEAKHNCSMHVKEVNNYSVLPSGSYISKPIQPVCTQYCATA